MRPVKRSLKLLENPGDNLTETEHVEQTRQVGHLGQSDNLCCSNKAINAGVFGLKKNTRTNLNILLMSLILQ